MKTTILAATSFLFISLGSVAYATRPPGHHYVRSDGGRGEKIGYCVSRSTLPSLRDLICNINNATGSVYLSGNYHFKNKNGGEELQALRAWIGKETFADPYKIRTKCESLKSAIDKVVSENWYFVGCGSSGTTISTFGAYYKSLDFSLKMSEAETKLGTLRFFPRETITSDFTFTQEEQVCDPL